MAYVLLVWVKGVLLRRSHMDEDGHSDCNDANVIGFTRLPRWPYEQVPPACAAPMANSALLPEKGVALRCMEAVARTASPLVGSESNRYIWLSSRFGSHCPESQAVYFRIVLPLYIAAACRWLTAVYQASNTDESFISVPEGELSPRRSGTGCARCRRHVLPRSLDCFF